MTTPTDPLKFILAGNATFTVVSAKTSTRFTYRVRQPKPDSPHFVSVLSGPDNEKDYQFLGTIFDRSQYKHGFRSSVEPTSKSAVAARWVCERLLASKPLVNCELHHEGRCGRCGRKLTVPESILTGLGPECANKI